MLTFLEHLYQTLNSDPVLTKLVSADSIGLTIRRPTVWPCIEYDIGFKSRARDGKQYPTIIFFIHSKTGAKECWEIEDAIHPLMTAAKLSNKERGFVVSSVVQSDAKREPRSEWAATVQLVYTMKIVELSPVHHHQ